VLTAWGIGYLVLWSVAGLILLQGATVLGQGFGCTRLEAVRLFYWTCSSGAFAELAASFANMVLTLTVWSPVYIAAGVLLPDARFIATLATGVHAVGLPAAIYVLVHVAIAGVRWLVATLDPDD
jgi:hypothetical protein